MATKVDDLEAVRSLVESLKDFDAAEQERIIRWAREKLGLSPTSAFTALVPPVQPVGGEVVIPLAGGPQNEDIRSFITSKNPKSDNHFAATVAYYYRFSAPAGQRKEAITADDLQEACRMAHRDRLKRPDQTLVNAHHAGLLDNVRRGAYSINAVGENLVAMALPDSGSNVKSAKTKTKKAKKKGNAKQRRVRPR
jgi:hypothetical protein